MKYRIKEVRGNWGSPKYVLESKIWWHFKWLQIGVPESFLSDVVRKIKRREDVKVRVLKRKEWDNANI